MARTPLYRTLVPFCALGLATAAATAAPTFYSGMDDGGLLQSVDSARVEARFKADTTNWDSRLEFDSNPANGDVTTNVGNGRTTFENRTFGFELAYDADAAEVSWTITRPDESTSTLVQNVSSFGVLNTINLSTTGSRGEVSLTDVAFVGLGITVDAFPNIDTNPGGPTFRQTFLHFGEGLNLLSGNWSLSGMLHFGDFTRSNPNEGAKITAKLRNGEVIPAPGAGALLGLAGLAAARRRR